LCCIGYLPSNVSSGVENGRHKTSFTVALGAAKVTNSKMEAVVKELKEDSLDVTGQSVLSITVDKVLGKVQDTNRSQS